MCMAPVSCKMCLVDAQSLGTMMGPLTKITESIENSIVQSDLYPTSSPKPKTLKLLSIEEEWSHFISSKTRTPWLLVRADIDYFCIGLFGKSPLHQVGNFEELCQCFLSRTVCPSSSLWWTLKDTYLHFLIYLPTHKFSVECFLPSKSVIHISYTEIHKS